jgi:hypothetical protein
MVDDLGRGEDEEPVEDPRQRKHGFELEALVGEPSSVSFEVDAQAKFHEVLLRSRRLCPHVFLILASPLSV